MRDKRNTTRVIGVCRQEYRERSGRWFVRYIAEWPKSDGTRGSASFSVNLYGEEDAFELAVYCRRKGLQELGLPRAYFGVRAYGVLEAPSPVFGRNAGDRVPASHRSLEEKILFAP